MRRTPSYFAYLLAAVLIALSTGPATAQDQQRDSSASQELPIPLETPAGFEATLFAGPPDVNYPTAITAAGTAPGALFVAVDRNGSLGQKRGRGQVIRAEDTDQDGHADRFTTFVDSVESPRGLVYDGATLYVMHPPTLTAYQDTDGDGRADRARTLIEGLGFDLDFRGADHTTNGIQMGIDGWLYVAVGDYGFTDAVGADGTRLTHRGGAIVRVRPDGSEMELVAEGLRNVYDIALDPYLNGFVRGNTNDGGGWDVRLNRIVLGANYGYPTLFKHFPDEVLPPLADYGGGSGTGAYFLDEPGVADSLSPMLYTVDWGRSMIYRHPMEPEGASFAVEQEPFLQIPAPTDFTVDGRSRLYVSSWFKGGFRYTSEDVGFIARLAPTDSARASLQAPAGADTEGLVRLLGSESQVHRLQAQREILRREAPKAFASALEAMATSAEEPLSARVAAVFTLKQLLGEDSHDFLLRLAREGESEVQAFALRALADRQSQLEGVPAEPFVEALSAADPRARLEAVTGLARLDAQAAASELLPLTASSDSVLSHVAMQALVSLRAADASLEALEREEAPELRAGALQVLKRLHEQRVVEGLAAALEREQTPAGRHEVLEALARLYHQEGDWSRDDWWGTKPDTRGPYYNPVPWTQSEQIKPLLQNALIEALQQDRSNSASNANAPDTLLAIFERNRVLPSGASALVRQTGTGAEALQLDLARALVGQASVPSAAAPLLEKMAQRGDSLQASVVQFLGAQRSDLPLESLPLLRRAALAEALPSDVRSAALTALDEATASVEQGRAEATQTFAGLGDPDALSDDLAETWRRYAQRAEHVKSVDYFTELARDGSAAEQTLAYVVLLNVARTADDGGDDDENETEKAAREKARQAVSKGWNAPAEQTAGLLRAVGYTGDKAYAERAQALRTDERQPAAVREAAAFAAERLEQAEETPEASSSN